MYILLCLSYMLKYSLFFYKSSIEFMVK